jgi:type I restriction enzyme M protein
LSRLQSQKPVDDFQSTLGLIVSKEKISANGDYILSGERYRENDLRSTRFPFVALGELCDLARGVTYNKNDEVEEGGHQVLRANNIDRMTGMLDLSDVKHVSSTLTFSENKKLRKNDIFICLASGSKDHIGKVAMIMEDTNFYFGGFMGAVRIKSKQLNPIYLYHQLRQAQFNSFLRDQIAGANINNLGAKLLYEFRIPLPPLDVQEEIVAEIEGYQKVIDGARAVVDNYRPQIPIQPDWPKMKLVDAPLEIIDGDRGVNYPRKEDFTPSGHCLFLNTKNVREDGFNFTELLFITEEKDQALRKGKLERGDVVLTTRGTIGNTGFYDESVEFEHIRINSGMLIFRPDTKKLDGNYLFHFIQSNNFKVQRDAIVSGSAQPQLPIRNLSDIIIPIPNVNIQRAIVTEIESEKAMIAANRELITRFEKKIQATLARIWGDDKQTTVGVLSGISKTSVENEKNR